MHRSPLAFARFACLLAAAGCDDGATTGDMTTTGNDQSVAADLSAGPADMAVVADMAGQSCLQIITCAAGCGTNDACVGACAAAGSPAAQTLYQALFGCAYAQCLPVGDGGAPIDGGAGSCDSTMDPSMVCRACVSAQAQGPACSTQLGACLGG